MEYFLRPLFTANGVGSSALGSYECEECCVCGLEVVFSSVMVHFDQLLLLLQSFCLEDDVRGFSSTCEISIYG